MVETIEGRRVTSVPMELEASMRMEPFCVCCKEATTVSTCSGCKLVTYCGKECQQQDWKRHSKEEECIAIRNLRRQLEQIEAVIQANGCMLLQEVIMKFGNKDDTWLGRGEPSMMEMMGLMSPPGTETAKYSEKSIMHVIAGRFLVLQYTREYMDCLLALNAKIVTIAHNHHFMPAYEEALSQVVEAKRLTHAVHPDMCDREIPKMLLKLHRDDDAVAFIRYWLKWRSQGQGNLRDPLVLLSSKGEWPFPVEKDCRLLDITDELRNVDFQEGDRMYGEEIHVPVSFCLVPLVIKLRHVCVYIIRSKQALAFAETECGLPNDAKYAIVSFITGGNEFHALYEEQCSHINHLMDLIDENYPNVLQGTLNPSVLPAPRPGRDSSDDDLAFDFGAFIMTFGCGSPVKDLLVDIIEKRYGLIRYEIPEEIRGDKDKIESFRAEVEAGIQKKEDEDSRDEE